MDKFKLTVTSAFGVESLTKKELKNLGVADPKSFDGSFDFYGGYDDIARLNIFLRTGDRVFLNLASFSAETFDDLFDGTNNFPWEDFIPKDGSVVVNGKSVKSKLFSLSDCQRIVKKAIMTRLSKRFACKTLPESGAKYEVIFSIRNDVATLYLNTSGKGLHKRGYRDLVGDAPIKETLASALIDLSPVRAESAFIDPFCGSGTLVIEAAQKCLGIAPGKNRDFDFAHWDFFDKTALTQAREEALSAERLQKLRFAGYDVNPAAVKLALRHAERAGVRDYVHFQVRDVKDLASPYKSGCIVTNPPYGERLMTPKDTRDLYRTFANVCADLPDWSVNVITSAVDFEKSFGRRADKTRKFFNANKECRFFMYSPVR